VSKKETIVITGSSGWLSQNFIRILKNKYNTNKKIITISSQNDWKKINTIDNDIHLIHNAFVLPQSNKIKTPESYQQKLDALLKDTIEFIKNNNIQSLYYPSSGLVNIENHKDSEIYSIYKEQKKKEEKQFTELSNQYNFTLVISRIFSLLGPISSQPPKSNFISLITQGIELNKIIIESETDDTHSICFLDHLVYVVIDLLFDSKKGLQYFFDAVDVSISLKDFSLQVANCLNLEEKDIVENFKSNQVARKYVGNDTQYKTLLNNNEFIKYELSSYLAKIINK
tara:strand:- start:413 stop:1264 length:852 start_codon:yes stop_codon:yes gene_type:complete